jgi:hypothetical protein
MKLEFSRQILEKYSKTKFHENPFSGIKSCSMRTDGQTLRIDYLYQQMHLLVQIINYKKMHGEYKVKTLRS